MLKIKNRVKKSKIRSKNIEEEETKHQMERA